MPIGAFKLNSIAKYIEVVLGRTAKTITVQGNAQVSTAQSKFGGASLYNDGNGDYIEVVNSNSFSLGTGNFTIELWWRATSRAGSYPPIITNFNDSYSADEWGLFDRHNSYPTKFMFDCYNIVNTGPILVSTTSVSNATWYHLAIVRNGTTFTLYVNGTSEATYTSSASVDSGNYKNLFLGAVNGNYSNGHTDEVRISKTARYTSNFTPSTSPFTNDADTLFLMHGNGTNASTSFIDDIDTNDTNRTPHTVARSSTGVTTSTAQSKFGGSSILFGSGHYLTVTNHNATEFEFTAGEDFTIEFWFRYTSIGQFNGIVGMGTSRGSAANNADIYIESSSGTPSGPEIRFATNYGSPVALNSGTSNTLTANTWYHYAVTRSGTTFRAFLNGSQVATTTATTTVGQQTTIKIGTLADGTNGYTGYVDELRISRTARYTAGFTPSTSAFTNDAYTMLLLHGDGTNGGSTFTDSN